MEQRKTTCILQGHDSRYNSEHIPGISYRQERSSGRFLQMELLFGDQEFPLLCDVRGGFVVDKGIEGGGKEDVKVGLVK